MFYEELELVRSINDPIHGSIKLSNDEMNIIEHPLFKRLHNVRQNSFLYKVFPSAKHTRFEHSIGVMHCAHKLFVAAVENGIIAKQDADIATQDQYKSTKDAGVGVGIALSDHLKIDDFINPLKNLRIAALLHDIGHGPLSHLFDSYAPSINEFQEVLNSDEIVNSDEKYKKAFIKMLKNYERNELEKGKQEIRIEHEHISSYFTFRILNELKFKTEEIHSILTILKPELELNFLKAKIFGEEHNISKLLTDIVASAPIDCDRMDYLKRDSYFAGVPYGNYSEDRILKTVLPYSLNGEMRLGLKISGLHAIEGFLLSRYQMFVQVYGHKTNEACNAMLEYISKNQKLSFEKWSRKKLNSEDFISLYLELSDEKFLSCLSEALKENDEDEKSKTITNLQNRDLWKRVYEIEEYVPHKSADTYVSRTFNDLFENMKETYKDIQIYKGDRFPLKDIKKVGAKILDKNNNSFYTVSNKQLQEGSQIIKSLNNGLRIHRIYTRDKEKVKEIKHHANEHIHPKIIEAEREDFKKTQRV